METLRQYACSVRENNVILSSVLSNLNCSTPRINIFIHCSHCKPNDLICDYSSYSYRCMHPQLELTHILEVVVVLAEGEVECVEGMLVVFLSTKKKHQ